MYEAIEMFLCQLSTDHILLYVYESSYHISRVLIKDNNKLVKAGHS